MTRTTTLWSLLLLSAALALGSCTKDATEQATGPEPEAKAASKLVFSSENAVRGELLVCFGEEAVAGIESSVMQVTRSGGVATRSGIADFDAVLGSIGVKALQPQIYATITHSKLDGDMERLSKRLDTLYRDTDLEKVRERL